MKRIAKTYLCFIWILAVLAGCTQEDLTQKHRSQVLPDGRIKVPIKLHLPQRNEIQTKTTDLTNDESRINNLYVFVFEAPDEGNAISPKDKLIEIARATMSAVDEADVTLQEYDKECYLRVCANLTNTMITKVNLLKPLYKTDGSAEAAPTSTRGDCLALVEKVEESLYHANKFGQTPNPPYPMTSTREFLKKIDETTYVETEIDTDYARIDVDATSASNFTLTSATLLNGAKQGYMIYRFDEPLPVNLGGPTVEYLPTPASGNIVSPIYLFPNNGQDGANPTELLVRGTYRTSAGIEYDGYYRIQIRYEKVEAPDVTQYDIAGNTLYKIVINSIEGPGYPTPEEAKANPPVHEINYTVDVDDGSSFDIVVSNGEHYMGFTNSEYILYTDNSVPQNNLVLTTCRWGKSQNSTITSAGEIHATGSITVNTPFPTQGTPTDIQISLPKNFSEGTVSFRMGNLEKTITVKQKGYRAGIQECINDMDNTDIVYATSEACWITLNSQPIASVGGAKAENAAGGIYIQLPFNNDNKRRRGIVYAHTKNNRGRVKIDIVQYHHKVVYYERYSSGKWGFYNNIDQTTLPPIYNLDIIEAGYGVLIEAGGERKLAIGNYSYPVIPEPVGDIYGSGSTCYLYRLDQTAQLAANVSQYTSFTPQPLTFDNHPTNQYILPHFAAGIYSSQSIPTNILFIIRTPQQFRNIGVFTNGAADSSNPTHGKAFRQALALNFSVTSVGGGTLDSAVVKDIFAGTFDGNWAPINNLTITNNSDHYLALFAQSSGTLQNIRLNSGSITGQNYVAGIVGLTHGGRIQNCTNTNCNITGTRHVGGIAGGVTDTYINNCTNTSTIGGSGQYVGGITGRYTDTNLSNTDGLPNDISGSFMYYVINCMNGGAVRSSADAVGGIAGSAHGKVYNCYNTGDIHTTLHTAGGIIGHGGESTKRTKAIVMNCYNRGTISGITNIAGILGTGFGANNNSHSCQVKYSYARTTPLCNFTPNYSICGTIPDDVTNNIGIVPDPAIDWINYPSIIWGVGDASLIAQLNGFIKAPTSFDKSFTLQDEDALLNWVSGGIASSNYPVFSSN